VGFAKGVTAVHLKLEKLHRTKERVITLKLLLVFTSRGDDELK
jgi:hypothetical protein